VSWTASPPRTRHIRLYVGRSIGRDSNVTFATSGDGNGGKTTPSVRTAEGEEHGRWHRFASWALAVLLTTVRCTRACNARQYDDSALAAWLHPDSSVAELVATNPFASLPVWQCSPSSRHHIAYGMYHHCESVQLCMQVVGVLLRIQADARAYTKWLQVCGLADSAEVSIVVPVLNEENNVEDLCSHLQQLQPPAREVIFVDGGSTDRSAPQVLLITLVAMVRLCMHCAA
jgi:Glycosyl transferase family 2